MKTSDPDRSQLTLPRGFPLVLALSMGAGPLTLQTLTATAPLVTADLGITRAQLGSLPTAAFLTAALLSPVVGRGADLFSGRAVLAVLFSGAGLALLGTAAAPSYAWLLAAAAVSGAAQAMSNPVTNQLIAANVAPGLRGRLTGIKQSGVQMSQFAAGLVLPSVALLLGWRGAAAAAAVATVTGLLLVRGSVPAGSAEPLPASGGGREALPSAVGWLAAYAFITGAAIQATNVYLPLYSFERLHMPVQTAGLTVAVAGGVGLVARIAWGRAAERVVRPGRPLLALATASVLASFSILAADRLHAPVLVWVGAALFGAGGLASNVVLMLALMRATPLRGVGTASGILAVGLYLGFALGPLGYGLVVDHTGSYGIGWLTVVGVNVAAAALAVVGGPFLRRSGRRDPPEGPAPRLHGLPSPDVRQEGRPC
ncbi:MAG: MFS transporter [Streptomyces sp.]|uniref:MFS transporter n=1 Tax=Streptomyces sp. TaxID=1931 RepID=UPI003D6B4061